MGIKILGTGSFTPEKILKNIDLEKMVDTTDEWIRTRTGIEERHIAEDNIPNSELSLQAAKNAIEMAKISPEEIDLIVLATITADKTFPSTACILQTKLGAKNAVCFDLGAACSGFLYALETASAMLQTNSRYKKVLIIGSEKMSSIVDWEDRNTCVLFGDGAGAMVLAESDEENALLGSYLGSNGDYEEILQIPAGGSAMPFSQKVLDEKSFYLKMAGQEVFKLAVNSMVSSCKKVLEEAGVEASEIRWLIPHQANYRILKAVASRLKIKEDNVFMNVQKYGNTSAASIGIAFDEMVRQDKIKKGEYILLTAFGGGLTWGAILLRW